MKINELRIGNIVFEQYSGQMIVTGLNSNNTVLLSKSNKLSSGQYNIESISPILLTNELLRLKFQTKHYMMGDNYYLSIYKDTFYLRPSYLGGYYYGINLENGYEFNDAPTINYLHELQNLYFAISKTELEFNTEDDSSEQTWLKKFYENP